MVEPPPKSPALELELEAAEPPPYTIFTPREVWFIVILVSTAGIFSPLTANIYFPVIPAIADDLNVSVEQINLTVTFYMFMQGISPTIWGSLCDVLGRRPVYLATFTVYIGASIGLALTHVYWLLILLRCLQAAGAASVIAIGAGTIGDVAPPSTRGGFMGIFSLGAMLGPCLGPLVGGLLAQAFGWQSLFWFTTAFAGVMLALMIIFLPETLRSMVGNGSIPAKGINRSLFSLFRARHNPVQVSPILEIPPRKSWRNVKPWAPFQLFREKDVLLILTFSTVVYTLFYCVITSMASSLKTTYHLSETELGLAFLSNGGGCVVAALLNGPTLNRDYQTIASRMKAREADQDEAKASDDSPTRDVHNLSRFPIEHARLRSLPPYVVVMLASCIIYGWTLGKAVHISVPLICQFFTGLCSTSIFNSISTLLVDLFPGQSASATAANNLYRCLFGAAGTAVIEPTLSALGPGWTFTMLTLITLLFVPLIVIEWFYGMSLRAQRATRILNQKQKKEGFLPPA